MTESRQSNLHLQMGQEVIYLILTIAVMSSVVLAALLSQATSPTEPTPSAAIEPPPAAVEPLPTAPPPEELAPENPSPEDPQHVADSLPVDETTSAPQDEPEPPETEAPPPELQPPLITLRESDGYSFASGSAELDAEFARRLKDEIIPQILKLSVAHKAEVVEVVGHTDGEPFERNGDLDKKLHKGLAALADETLRPSDNVGLGLVRAISVALALRAAGLREPYVLIPLSAGPLVAPGDAVVPSSYTQGDASRRRIEIRLRRRDRLKQPDVPP